MKKKVVYVSGPYRASSDWEKERNIARAREAARRVWLLGAVAICPHANTAFMDGDGIDFISGDLELVDRSDAVLLLPGHESSEGSRMEAGRACTRGIPVFDSLEALEKWLNPSPCVRTFATGAIRDTEDGKIDPLGYLSPLVLLSYSAYMRRHQELPGGGRRASDDWKKGIPRDAYARSLARHFLDFWLAHEGYPEKARSPIEDSLNAILFNAMGYLHELLKSGKSGESGES